MFTSVLSRVLLHRTSSIHPISYTLVHLLKRPKPSIRCNPNPPTSQTTLSIIPTTPPHDPPVLHSASPNNPRQQPLLLSQPSFPLFNITLPLRYASHPSAIQQLGDTNRKPPPIKTIRISVLHFQVRFVCLVYGSLLAKGCSLWVMLGGCVSGGVGRGLQRLLLVSGVCFAGLGGLWYDRYMRGVSARTRCLCLRFLGISSR